MVKILHLVFASLIGWSAFEAAAQVGAAKEEIKELAWVSQFSRLGYELGNVFLGNKSLISGRLDTQASIFTTSLADVNERFQSYQVRKVATVAGLEMFLTALEKIEKDEEAYLHVFFRGTSDMASASRSFENKLQSHMPGDSSFRDSAPAILDALKPELLRYQEAGVGVHLMVSGHSLGAADCTSFAVMLLELLAIDSYE